MSPRPLETRVLIAIQRPERWIIGFGVLLFLVLSSMWLSYEYGRQNAGLDVDSYELRIAELQTALGLAQAEIAESAQRAAMLERNSQIDGDASDDLKQSMETLQNEALELRKELSFYKSIVAPESGKRSVAIQTIQLEPDGNGGYDYRIMVSQRGRNDRFLRGKLEGSLSGSQDGESVVIPLKNVSKEASKPFKLGFKYFQNIEGNLKLPATFKPESMRIQVNPSLKSIDKVDELFTWTDLTAGGN